MPGASPTIKSCALASPNESTGALNQSGSRLRAALRKSASRGQSGQLESGLMRGEAAMLAILPKRFPGWMPIRVEKAGQNKKPRFWFQSEPRL
jgi:hypothetical protein